jgi:DNA-binding transcriptional LysR family regulator
MNIEKLSLDQLRVLVVAAEEGSFSAAARRLNRVQSAVTYTIQQLEQQLGFEVFDRSGYRPKLNGAGESILEDARIILARADSLLAKAGAHAAGLEDSLAITVDVMTPFDALAAVLRDFDATYPTVTLRLHVEAMGEVVRHVADGIADVALLCSLATAPENFTLYGIGHVTLVPVASPAHPLAAFNGAIPPEALREHRQIVLNDRSELSRGQDFNVYSPQTWRVSDLGSKHALILGGLGFGHMPTHMIAEDLRAGRLRELMIPAHPAGGDRLPIYCAHRGDRAMGRALRWLVDRFARFEAAS